MCGDDVRVLAVATPEIRPILEREFKLNFGLDLVDSDGLSSGRGGSEYRTKGAEKVYVSGGGDGRSGMVHPPRHSDQTPQTFAIQSHTPCAGMT